MSTATLTPNTRIIHRAHPEYGFGLVRYVEEDAFGETRLQVSFDHLDNLENVAPDQVEIVGDPLADAAAGDGVMSRRSGASWRRGWLSAKTI